MLIELIACSGPGALNATYRSIDYGFAQAGVFACLVAGSMILWVFARRWILLPVIAGVMFAVHPAWTVSGGGGDCGFSKRELSDTFNWLGILLLIAQAGASWWFGPSKRARWFRRGLCPACGYDLRGSAGRGECPECGEAIGRPIA